MSIALEKKSLILWGLQCLKSHGYTLKSNQPEEVKNTPWSYVARFATTDGYIYLKHTPNLLALEASIIQILQEQFHASVPEIIAHQTELHCFLMKDAGRPLRERIKQSFDTTLLCKAIDQFTLLQLATANHVDVFLDIGVPDWRLDQLPHLYRELLSQKDLLIADGLSAIEISELEAHQSTIFNCCEKLPEYGIKETIVQPDFHDNNLLIDDKTQNITFIDLGEIVISHPFFSLLTCLQQTKKHYVLTEADDAYLQLREACLRNYKVVASEKQVLEAFEIARILGFVYGVLAQHRLMIACGKEKIRSLQPGKLKHALKELMTACIAINWKLSALKLVIHRPAHDLLSGFQENMPIILKRGTALLKQEARALQYFEGYGAVTVLALQAGGLLLERAIPGTSLKFYFPDQEKQALQIAYSVMQRLHQAPLPKAGEFPHIRDELAALEQSWDIPSHYLLKARALRDQLLATAGSEVLLHGDFHHDNILQNGKDWIVIDPKGVIGESAYEVAAFIRNPIPELLQVTPVEAIIRDRITYFSTMQGTEAKRIQDWCFVQAVLAWVWAIEDGMDTDYFKRLTECFYGLWVVDKI